MLVQKLAPAVAKMKFYFQKEPVKYIKFMGQTYSLD